MAVRERWKHSVVPTPSATAIEALSRKGSKPAKGQVRFRSSRPLDEVASRSTANRSDRSRRALGAEKSRTKVGSALIARPITRMTGSQAAAAAVALVTTSRACSIRVGTCGMHCQFSRNEKNVSVAFNVGFLRFYHVLQLSETSIWERS